MSRHPELFETLRQAQRFGFFGDRAIDEAVAHADRFVAAIEDRSGRMIDLGAGGGLPGLVIADARRDLQIVLLDRRQKRTDFLERAVRRLELDNVVVWCRDATDVVAAVAAGRSEDTGDGLRAIDDEMGLSGDSDVDVTGAGAGGFDIVTARGFGPPEFTLRTAAGCLRADGCVVISEPPSGDRWPQELLDELDLSPTRLGAVIRFDRR